MTTPEPLRLPEQAMPIARTVAGPDAPRPDVPDEAVKAVAEQLLSDYDAEFDAEFDAGHLSRKDFTGQARKLIEVASPHIREQVAAELEALRDGVENKGTPYNEAFIHALDCAVRAVRREAG